MKQQPMVRAGVGGYAGGTRRKRGVRPSSPSGLSYVATPNKFSIFGPELEVAQSPSDGTYRTGFGTFTADTAAPFGGYVESTNFDNNFYCVGMPLGPKFSSWVVTVWYRRGSDAPLIDVDWATVTIDQYAAEGFGSSRSVSQPPAWGGAWYNVGGGTSNYQIDCYHASDTTWQYARKSLLVITGDDGALLSANGAAPGTSGMDYTGTNVRAMSAGGDPSLYWYLRLHVNGKNASSSGYKARIAGISVARADGGAVSLT